MPIYEYQCSKCGLFGVVQKASDKPLKRNPDCAEKNCPKSAKRLISAAAFHLKGSGWYKTDYASSGSSSASSSSSSGTSGSGSSGSSDSSSDSNSGDTKKKKKKGEGSSGSGTGKASCGSGCGCH